MSHAGETFFTAVGCMDGRALRPVRKYGKAKFGVFFVDMITEAGLVGLLAKKSVKTSLLSSIKEKILISLEKHHSKGIVIHGHQECAGNPVADEQHKKDVLKTAQIIRTLIQKEIPIIPVFVGRQNGGWIIEEL